MRRKVELKVVPRDATGDRQSDIAPLMSEKTVETSLPEGNLFDTFERVERFMQTYMNRALGGFTPLHLGSLLDRFSGINTVVPSVDIYEEGKYLVVKAELPGMERDNINVRLLNNSLIISGEKKSERSEGNKEFYRIERSSGSFERSIILPSGINGEKASASFTNGILEVRIPKSSEQKLGREIAIK